MNIIKKIKSLCRKSETVNEERQENKPTKVNEQTSIKEQYIETESGIYRADGKSIQDEDIPYLVQRDLERVLIKEEKQKQGFTAHELRLAENFEINHFDGYSEIENKLLDLEESAKKEMNLSKKIKLLEDTITMYEKLKKFCCSKGKGGTIFFQMEWESKPFISEIQKELHKNKKI